jgi:hypothetical protein
MTAQHRPQGALFPAPRNWTERIGAWLCQSMLDRATAHYYDTVEALERSRAKGIELEIQLAESRKRP